MYNRQKFLPIMLALFALSLMPVTLVTAPATASTKTQVTRTSKAINSAEILAPEMKIAKESDVFTSTGEIIYVWIAWYSDTPTLIVYSKEYNETTGAYQYALTRIDSTGSMTRGLITILNWDVQWQIVLNRSIVWGRISDVDGDYVPEIITIPDTENLTVIYDDDGSELASFEIPEYSRALVVTDWTNDGVDDVVLVEGAYTDITGSYYLAVTVFDIYTNDVIELSPIYISGEFYVDEAFPGDWNLSTAGVNDILLIDWVYAKCLILSSDRSVSEVITLTDNGYIGDYIALHTNYVALSFYDDTYDADGIAIIYNGSLLWKYLLPSDRGLTSLQITELDDDETPELIVTTDYDVRIHDIEEKSAKSLITIDDWSWYAVLPLDLDIDGTFETILINHLGWNFLSGTPFSEWFFVPCWSPYISTFYSICKLFNSTSPAEVSNVTIPGIIPDIIYLTSEDIDGDFIPELLGIYSASSQTLAVYSITEAIPPSVDILSPADGSWVGDYVRINASASDEHSGIYTLELLINDTSHGYWSPSDTYCLMYWDATDYPEATYNLTVIAYDGVNNTASKSIIVHLDKTLPTIGAITPANKSWVSGVVNIRISANDSRSGIAYVAFYTMEIPPTLLRNDTEHPYTCSWNTNLYAEGVQHLIVYVVDKAGNYRWITLEYYVDNTPPSLKIVSPEENEYISGSFNISVTADDAKSGISMISFIIDGVAVFNDTEKPYVYTVDSTSYADGLHNITVVAYDKAGNSKTASINIYIDNTPPTISKVQYPQEVEEGTNIVVNMTISDALSGVDRVILSYSTDGGKTWKNITATSLGNNTYQAIIPAQPANTQVQFKIYVYDVAGNVFISHVYSCKVTPKPVLQIPSTAIIAGAGAAAALTATAIIVKRRMAK